VSARRARPSCQAGPPRSGRGARAARPAPGLRRRHGSGGVATVVQGPPQVARVRLRGHGPGRHRGRPGQPVGPSPSSGEAGGRARTVLTAPPSAPAAATRHASAATPGWPWRRRRRPPRPAGARRRRRPLPPSRPGPRGRARRPATSRAAGAPPPRRPPGRGPARRPPAPRPARSVPRPGRRTPPQRTLDAPADPGQAEGRQREQGGCRTDGGRQHGRAAPPGPCPAPPGAAAPPTVTARAAAGAATRPCAGR
jgi:hypothetical protein